MRELCRFKTVFTMSALTLIVACSAPAAETEDDNDGGEAASGGQDAQGGADQGGGGNGGMGGGPDLPQGWTSSAHPCVGNRTDSMLFEADNTVWTGCGSTTIGYGLYMSTDAGMTFSAPETTPAGWFDTYRVLDVSRSSDGLLYVAGTATTNSSMVVSVDTSVSPMVVTEVLNAGPTIDESFIAGTFRRRADGSAIAESLNGNGMLYRPSDSVGPDAFSDGWENAYYWANGGSASFQLLDMEIHDEAFYGCGSTIADTPKLFLPNASAANAYNMDVVELDTFDGEMWGMDVAPDGSVIVGGVNQNLDVGMVYFGDPSSLSVLDVSTIVSSGSTWIRGVCTNGTRLVAVGELSMTSDPLVFTSGDGGRSWSNETPDAAPGPLHECTVLSNGSFAVAGADGYIGIYVP